MSVPLLGDPLLDQALDGVWLADLGQGDLRQARTRAETLDAERSPIRDLACGVVDHLQGRYPSALGRYERAFQAAESSDRGFTIASLAGWCELQRHAVLADGRHTVFTEATACGWGLEDSVWEDRWKSFTDKSVSAEYRLVGHYIHDFLAQLPAIIDFAIDLRNHESEAVPPDDLLRRSGLNHAVRAIQLGFWPMTLRGALAAAEILALAGHPERAEQVLRDVRENPVTDDGLIEAVVALCKGRLAAAPKPWGLIDHLGFLPRDGTGIDAGLPQPDRRDFDRSKIPIDEMASLFETAKRGFESLGMTRGAAAAECGLAYGDYVRGEWVSARQRFARAGAGFAWVGDELRRFNAYAGESITACRGYAPKSDLRQAGKALGEFAAAGGALAWGLGMGLTYVEAAKEALLSNDVDATLGLTELAAAAFTVLDVPIRLAQVMDVRASAYTSVQATTAALVELYRGMALLNVARSRSSIEAKRAAPAAISFHSNVLMLAATETDADEVERQQQAVREWFKLLSALSEEDCARIDAIMEEARRAAVELAAGVESEERAQILNQATKRGSANIEDFLLCRQREHVRWFDTMARALVPTLRARTHMRSGHQEAAAQEFQTALAIADAHRDLYGRARLLNDWHRRDEALSALRAYIESGYQSWVDRTVRVPAPDRSARRRHAAQLAAELEAWDLADEEYRKVGLAWDATDGFDPNTHLGGYLDLLNLTLLANVYGHKSIAETLFERLGVALETRRRLLSGENLRLALGSDPVIHRVYGEWTLFLTESNRWTEAFSVAEVARARTLTESIAIGRQGDAAPGAYQRFREQAGLVERLTGQLAARHRARADGAAANPEADAALQTAAVELQRRELELLDVSPNLRRLQLPRESLANLDETARLLPPDVLLLAFQIYHRHILGWAVDRSGLLNRCTTKHFATEPLNAWLFAARVREWVSRLEANAPTADLELQLSAALLEPFAADIKNHRHVVIVPHRDLNLLPFHALPWQGSRLGFRKPVSYLPAASMLKLFGESSASGEPVVIGDPTDMKWTDPVALSSRKLPALPAAGLEAAAVAGTYEVEPLIGLKATEFEVRDALGRSPKVVHLATHGLFEAASIFDSGIALASGDTLSIDELGALSLPGTLVVMSACDTGKGTMQGSELVGVVRSLLAAGARAALVSLWAAPDVASLLFMDQFHKLVANNDALNIALHSTRCWLAQCTAGDALAVIDTIPERAAGHHARVAMCRAEILALAGAYQAALDAVQSAQRSWDALGDGAAAAALQSQRSRYAILADAARDDEDLHRRVFAAPRFWAPFALFGNWQ